MSSQPQPVPQKSPHPVLDYLRASRGPWYSFLFALPVLVLYEVLELVFRPSLVNGADALLTRFLRAVPSLGAVERSQVLLLLLVVVGVVAWRVDALRRRDVDRRLRPEWFGVMLLESIIYGWFFGAAVIKLMQLMVPLQVGGRPMGLVESLTMALGAGIYEELLFRVIIMGGLAGLLVKGLRVPALGAWTAAAVASSLIFSLFHYVGTMGDTFTFESFFFRFTAGLLLAALYGLRGFGIAVWTHALYDILVMVFRL